MPARPHSDCSTSPDRSRRLPATGSAVLLHRHHGGVVRAGLPDDLRCGGCEAIMKRDVVKRYRGNPILTRDAIPYPVETVHNAAVVKRGGEYIMLFPSHLRPGRSIIGLAHNADGFHFRS